MDQSVEYAGFEFHGLSLSGIRTSISMPKLGICFDVAQGLPFTIPHKNFFITHGHLDHAAGIPYIISQKALAQETQPLFCMPQSLLDPLSKIMRLWEKIEGHEYKENFQGLQAGHQVDLNERYFVQAFQTSHRIDSLGYTLVRKSKKLKNEFRGLSANEIMRLANSGTDVNETRFIPEVSFTGDTQIEFIEQNLVQKSRVLFVECTYLDERKTIQHARDWGHIHLDELIPHLNSMENEVIVLKHLSARYSLQEAKEILLRKIPKAHQERVVLFPGR